MSSFSGFIMFVYTGEGLYAGTSNPVNVILHGDNGKSSKSITLNDTFGSKFSSEDISIHRLSSDDVGDLGRDANIDRLEIWKGYSVGLFSDDWFVDKIVVENTAKNTAYAFPLFRWIKSGHQYNIKHLNTSLPQFDAFPEQRIQELEDKRKVYIYEQKLASGVVQIKKLPRDEHFSTDLKLHFLKFGLRRRFKVLVDKILLKRLSSLDDILSLYDEETFVRPKNTNRWKSDEEFARRRLTGVNPVIISLMTEIPNNFPISDELVRPLLEGLTLKEAILQKRLFMCDLKILKDIPSKPKTTLCSPLAMFFVNNKKQLLPVAIQLFQKPGPDNPIFTPLDDTMLWTYVKMWYNNADATYHQILTHLGLTHIVMEGIVVASHRCLSSTHPVFKLLAPHFLYLLAINSKGVEVLINKGGVMDRVFTPTYDGILKLMAKGLLEWKMNVDGLLPEDLRARGVDDPNVLPGYYFRDDALMIFDTIKTYVSSYIEIYYPSNDELKEDTEIQSFSRELVAEKEAPEGGLGLKGVPGNGKLEFREDLISILVSIIYTCSVAHASANFGQYDEFAYLPNAPTTMYGKPPTSKDSVITEKVIFDSFMERPTVLLLLNVLKLLSDKGTNSLGDFEVQFVFDTEARKIVDTFRENLKLVGKKIRERNKELETPYEYLLPEAIPNAISI